MTSPAARSKVLVVDDEPENVQLLVRVLRRDYEVLTAGNGREALEKLEAFQPDLIITDQRMPDVDGVTLLESARKKAPDALRIMLTGYIDPQDMVAAINRGEVWRYVVKPLEVEELRVTVRQALERVSMVRERSRLIEELSQKAARLETASTALETINARLEELVRERTAELQKANSELQTALSQVSELARTDSLTGIYNRRVFEEVLSQEVSRALRFFRPVTLVILDLDHFKAVNDTQGHPAGDRVLQTFAKVLQSCCRTTDTPARIGGEEFALVLPETDTQGALVMVERVRKTLQFQRAGVTVSGGLSCYPDNGTVPKDLFDAADRALYEAKAAGRDRFVTATTTVVRGATRPPAPPTRLRPATAKAAGKKGSRGR